MNAKVALAAMRSLIATLFLNNKIEKAQGTNIRTASMSILLGRRLQNGVAVKIND